MRFVFLLLLLSPIFAQSSEWWGVEECEFQYFLLDESDYGYFIVSSNQIVVYIKSRDVLGGFDIFYGGVRDLGRGGLNYSWMDYSTEIPIAEVRIIDNRYFIFWKGFFDMTTGKHVLADDRVDIVVFGEKVEIERCAQ